MRNPFKRQAKASEEAPDAAAAKQEAARPAQPEPTASAKQEPDARDKQESAAPTTGAAQPAASADPQQRIDGLRAWLGQVDRKVSARSYAGGAAIVLALAAGIVGVVLALSAKDESATKDELSSLRNQVEQVSREASAAAEEEVGSVLDRLQSIEEEVSSLAGDRTTIERELEVIQDDIVDLRNQISDLESAGPSGSGGGGGGANQ
jgi:uncharacterized protein HemX